MHLFKNNLNIYIFLNLIFLHGRPRLLWLNSNSVCVKIFVLSGCIGSQLVMCGTMFACVDYFQSEPRLCATKLACVLHFESNHDIREQVLLRGLFWIQTLLCMIKLDWLNLFETQNCMCDKASLRGSFWIVVCMG